MLNATEIERYRLLEGKYFIESDRKNASILQWLGSRGTSFDCYMQYMNTTSTEDLMNNNIDKIRVIIYALHRPVQFLFFYWTLLIFIFHKFNFKKPVMKILLAHFILRGLGDVVDKLGDLFPRYFSITMDTDPLGNNIIGCNFESKDPEKHPFRWFLTRQVGIVLWYTGEIIADWYPLLRTKAVVKNKSIRKVYATCAIFNLTKIANIILHFTLSPRQLYREDGVYNFDHVQEFYCYYWTLHLIIIYSSVLYDYTVYRVLKKNVFYLSQSEEGFLKKFKTISEYRILISAIIGFIFLPLFSITIFIKFYYYFVLDKKRLDFTFDEIRTSICNVQYYMIFIDQIFLIFSKGEESSNLYANNYSKNSKNSKNSNINNHTSMMYKSQIRFSTPIDNDNNIFSNHKDTSINDQNSLVEYNSYLSDSINKMNINGNNNNNDKDNSNNNNNLNNINSNTNINTNSNGIKNTVRYSNNYINNLYNINNAETINNNNKSNISNISNIDINSNYIYNDNYNIFNNNSNSNSNNSPHSFEKSNSYKSIANYDSYNGYKSEWNYLK